MSSPNLRVARGLSFWISWPWPPTSNLSPSVCVTNLLIAARWDFFRGSADSFSNVHLDDVSILATKCNLVHMQVYMSVEPTILVTNSLKSLVLMCVHKSDNITIECNMLYVKWP